MKKALITIAIIFVIIGLIVLINNQQNKRVEEENTRIIENSIFEAQRSRRNEFRVINDFRDRYREAEASFNSLTSEDRANIDFRKEFAERYIGQTINLYTKILDIVESNGRRRINTYSPGFGLSIDIFDDDRIVTGVRVGDNVDINVIINDYYYSRGMYNESILTLQFNVLEIINNYRTSFPTLHGRVIDERIR